MKQNNKHVPYIIFQKFYLQNIIGRFSRQHYAVKASSQNSSYCLNLIKTRDYENYLCTLLLPTDMRMVGIVARAFNIELAQIQASTTEKHTAKMRTEFWRRNLEETFNGRPPAHPVFLTMAYCLYDKSMSAKYFTRMIDIRERYIDNIQFMSLEDAEDYGEYSTSSVFYLLLERLGSGDPDLQHAASHLGKALSLVTLLRSIPYFLSKNSVILPVESLVKHSLSNEDIVRGSNKKAVCDVVWDIASQAFIHLEHAKDILKKFKSRKNNIFLPVILCESFLSGLQKSDFDILNPKINQKNWTLALKLVIANWKKMY